MKIKSCTFNDNYSKQYAGVFYLVDIYNLEMDDNTFENNFSNVAGAIQIKNSRNLIIKNTIFRNNTGIQFAGALHIDLAKKTILSNVTGYDNKAGIGGFGYSNMNVEFSLINCDFYNNIA